MQTTIFRHAVSLLLGCLFFTACTTGSNDLEVKTGFSDEIAMQQNLNFIFNKDIYPDSMLFKWDSLEYVSIEPKVEGMFKWNSSSELVFSPAKGFSPGTEYTATFTKDLLKYSKAKYTTPSKKITFHTAPLRATSTDITWTIGQTKANVMVQLDIDFNYDVPVKDAAAKIKLSTSKGNIVTTTVNSGNGKRVSLQFMPVNELDEETPLKIQVDKGIQIVGSNYVTDKDTTIETNIPSRYNLTITGIIPEHTGEEGIITINTSQPIEEKGLKQLISIDPKVNFDVTTTESAIIINSKQLSVEQTYTVTIGSAMEGLFGGKMKSDFTEQVTFKKLSPSIAFADSKGRYLSSAGSRNVAINIVSVPKVKVSIIKVYENNLDQFLRKDRRYAYEYDEENDDGQWYDYYNTSRLGDTVYTEEVEVSKLPKNNASSLLKLDFQDKIKSYDGVYVLSVVSTDYKWVQDSKILSISDIGLIVKEERDNIYVFANSIREATPLSGVQISFISTTNQKLKTVTTDNNGIAQLSNIKKDHPGFYVGMVTAKKDGEFSFIWFGNNRVETSRFDVGGRVPNSTDLNAMIYAERNLYRPGEELHVSTIIRDESWNTPGEIPVKVLLRMPNGKEFSSYRKILNKEGSCEASFAVPHTAITGTYTVQVYTANDILLNSYNISIEEFVPDRIKSTLKTNKKEFDLTDSITATLQVDNLFGTPAAGRNYEMELNMNKKALAPKQLTDYNFSIKNDFNFSPQFINGTTDSKGSAVRSFALDKNMKDIGMLQGNVMATAFDETGRPVHRFEHITVYTQSTFLGIKDFDHYNSTGQPVHMKMIAVDKNGTVKNNVAAEVAIVKKEWHSVIEQNGSYYRYRSQKQDKLIERKTIKIDGKNTAYTFTPAISGEYEVRLYIKGSESYVSETFYSWGWGSTQYTSFEVNNEGNVTIKTGKDKYNVGEDMDLLFTTPFDGRMLVTLERDHVIEHVYLEAKNKSAKYTVKAGEVHIPNVYVTATLFRPMKDNSIPLTVAHGFKSITVEQKQDHIPVEVTAVEKSRSKSKQKITVKTKPGALVTVAAVDEGILQVKNYETPNPYNYFYQKVALSTNSYDVYPFLLPEIATRASSTGGDGYDETNMRVNPMFVNRIKNVSFWSGIKQADDKGIVTYEVDIPQFSGDIRVMALAYKGKGFGSDDKHMKVADPIVISTALPRFLSPKDEVVVPITLSNTTTKATSANVMITTTGPLGIVGDKTQQINIPANKEGRAVFNLKADQAIGACKVLVSVKALNETFTNETEIAVRPPASLQKRTDNGVANAGKSTVIGIENNFIPSSTKGQLIISKSPMVRFSKQLEDLVRYPYGCVEQTTSTAFPQLYYNDLVKTVTGKETPDMNPGYNVRQAILKLQSMQLSNGALSYWPNHGYESWWGSVYACHFLLEARKAGYQVNSTTVKRLQDYMKFKLRQKETYKYYYNNTLSKEIAAKEIAYSLYVLALANDPQYATMNYYKAHTDMLSLDSRYMLAAAYAVSGQPAKAREVLPNKFEGEIANKIFGGSFYSHIRDMALALNALMEINPNDPQVNMLANALSEQIRTSKYLSTQENVFSLLALGKIAQKANKTTGTATLLVDGKEVKTTNGNDIVVDASTFLNKRLSVKVSGTGNYYYFWQMSGITADGSFVQEDKFMRVRRNYYDRTGKPIVNNTFKQNQLVVVQIELESQYNSDIDNIVITDMLPAGFEIENKRLTDMPIMDWIKTKSTADYEDIRDDRINIFTSLDRKPKVFYYLVRAVSPGKYQLGPVQADAMYNGAYHSYHGAGVITIE